MDRRQHAMQLRDTLDAELSCARALLHSLHQERDALSSMDSPLLEAITAAKEDKLRELEGLASQRYQLAQTAGFATDKDGMQAYMDSWTEQSEQIAARWNQLLNILEQCQRQNRVNGGVIELSREQITTALGILRGQHGVAGSTYQPNGRSAKGLDPRSLGTA